MDVAAQVSAVRRFVQEGTRNGAPATVLLLERELPVTVERAWAAITDPQELPRWFLPVRGEERRGGALVEGGRYELAGNASGVVLTCDPPSRLLLTWEFGGDTSWVEVQVRPDEENPAGCLLTLAQTASIDAQAWARFGPGTVGVGWDLALLALSRYLAGRELAGTWAASPAGHSFIEAVSLAWGKASVLAGTPVDDAARAVQNTNAAYTSRS